VCPVARRGLTRAPRRAAARTQAGGLLLCATSRDNLPPALVLELLGRVGRVIKARSQPRAALAPFAAHARAAAAQDYCGVLTEDSLRKNFILVYELLDEMLDYGCACEDSRGRLCCAWARGRARRPRGAACGRGAARARGAGAALRRGARLRGGVRAAGAGAGAHGVRGSN
jgi:hypothetical protein